MKPNLGRDVLRADRIGGRVLRPRTPRLGVIFVIWALLFGAVQLSGSPAPTVDPLRSATAQQASIADCWDRLLEIIDNIVGDKDEEGEDCPDGESEPTDGGSDDGDSGSGGEGGGD